jgi:predicted RNA-binding protein associated with RNAse of E/G family
VSPITVYKRDHNGRVVWQYAGEVVARGADWVCLCAVFDRDEADLGFVIFRRGDRFTEWFYADRWYNVFRVDDARSGQLKGWYCNITRPARITPDSVEADDLALDVFVMPDRSLHLLDQDEFDALDLPPDERLAALRAVETIRAAAAARIAPFDNPAS